ncbi:hypothetical protein SPWS13_3829 [Shewanella putrefaciens]|nr:hypothetical protein SPWS13_3829 [Shewanella putrefaciens]
MIDLQKLIFTHIKVKKLLIIFTLKHLTLKVLFFSINL